MNGQRFHQQKRIETKRSSVNVELEFVHVMTAHFENGGNVAGRPPVQTKTVYFCGQILKTEL